MADQQPPAADAQHLRRGEIVAMAQALNFAARLTGVGRPGSQGQRQRAVDQPRAEHRHEREGEDQARHRHHHVGKPHQYPLQPPAIVAGEDTHQQPDGQGNGGYQRHQTQRRTCAVEQARQQVAAVAVGAEPVSRPGPLQTSGGILPVGIVRRQPRGEQRGQHQQDHQGQAAEGGG